MKNRIFHTAICALRFTARSNSICAKGQHALGFAFCTALIRNLLGTGSLLAFPGSMVGAFCCGMLYRYTKKLFAAVTGEVVGTGVLGGMLCYPVAKFLLGNAEAALFTYVIPFFISTLGGSLLAVVLLVILSRSGAFSYMNRLLLED